MMRPITALAIAAVLAAVLAACSSQKPAVRRIEKRDYYSVNKRSVAFLFDTFRQDKEHRREGNKQMWNWGEMRRENAWLQKHSIAFLWEALTVEEWTNAKKAWGTDLGRELMPEVNYWDSARFGMLDSGD